MISSPPAKSAAAIATLESLVRNGLTFTDAFVQAVACCLPECPQQQKEFMGDMYAFYTDEAETGSEFKFAHVCCLSWCRREALGFITWQDQIRFALDMAGYHFNVDWLVCERMTVPDRFALVWPLCTPAQWCDLGF